MAEIGADPVTVRKSTPPETDRAAVQLVDVVSLGDVDAVDHGEHALVMLVHTSAFTAHSTTSLRCPGGAHRKVVGQLTAPFVPFTARAGQALPDGSGRKCGLRGRARCGRRPRPSTSTSSEATRSRQRSRSSTGGPKRRCSTAYSARASRSKAAITSMTRWYAAAPATPLTHARAGRRRRTRRRRRPASTRAGTGSRHRPCASSSPTRARGRPPRCCAARAAAAAGRRRSPRAARATLCISNS